MIRQFENTADLANNEDFVDGIKNLEKENVITKYKVENTTILYRVNKKP